MKNLKIILRTVCFSICALSMYSLNAQDAHYSQFDSSPLMINPATAGMYQDFDWRVTGGFRSQWGSISFKLFDYFDLF